MTQVDLSWAARRVQAGDAAQFRTIVEHTQRGLFLLAARILGTAAEAEDVVQEAYVKAYRELAGGRFDGRSNVKTWIYRIVTNAAIDARRRRATRDKGQDQHQYLQDDGVAASDAEAHLALRQLAGWLDELPEEQRAAVVLKTIEGLSTREVAEVLQCTEGAVEQRLVRARATLKKKRQDHE